MLARIATFNALPDDLDDDAVDLLRSTIRETEGYVGGFHLVDPQTRKAMSVVVFEDGDAAQRAAEALGRRPQDRVVGIDPDHVEYFEAVLTSCRYTSSGEPSDRNNDATCEPPSCTPASAPTTRARIRMPGQQTPGSRCR